MKFGRYIRKPFTVEAVEITNDNIRQIAKLIGTLRKKDGEWFISVDRRIIPNIDRAYPGWFLTKLEDNYRVYAPKPFRAQFIETARFGNITQAELDKMLQGEDSQEKHSL